MEVANDTNGVGHGLTCLGAWTSYLAKSGVELWFRVGLGLGLGLWPWLGVGLSFGWVGLGLG